jgi:uncharacterized protein (DUF433 family)
MDQLLGIGVYTPAEASHLLTIPAGKIARWLRGHNANGIEYPRLWEPDINFGDSRVFLSFRDLMEVRVVDLLIKEGFSAIRVRRAIELARNVIGEHPLSSNRFMTVGREICLSIVETDDFGAEKTKLLNLFRRQYEFEGVLKPLLKTVDFGDLGNPLLWWPKGRSSGVVIDPQRSFGQPIESETSVPTAVLAAAAALDGEKGASIAYEVPIRAVRRAVSFESALDQRLAA